MASEMRTGHVAMLDILGWKGIWRRHGLDDVLAAGGAVRSQGSELEGVAAKLFQPPSREGIDAVLSGVRAAIAEVSATAVAEFDAIASEIPTDSFTEPPYRVQARFLSDTLA